MAKLEYIIEALGRHSDDAAVGVLEEIGTNCPIDEVREMTAQALIRRNSHDALSAMIISKGKGINDLSAKVAMSAINELLSLKDKTEAFKILDDTIEMHSDEDVRDTARSVKALMNYSC